MQCITLLHYLVVPLLLPFCAAAAASDLEPGNGASQQPVISQDAVFRDVEDRDLPALTTLVLDAFSPSLMYHYIAPDFDAHRDEIWQCTNASISREWSGRNRETTLAKVLAVDDAPVSVSIWNIRGDHLDDVRLKSFAALHLDCSTLPGQNATRATDYERQMRKILSREFSNATYPEQLYLNLLATHPAWDGHGFAARLVTWGQKLSRQLGKTPWPVTLLGTPAGYPLYGSLGFASVKNVTVEMLDEVDSVNSLWYEVMKWEAS